ncbi:hypothetical protein QOZ80_3AG0210390 [Eleusine coracana subsp. coracana]|nr:hypothetical protein QOZ80_3AG0210390 [Eleusine coracana subsp. coracana]
MGRFNRHAATDEKLQRLELLLIKIRVAIETSEKHKVKNTWLVQWREKLKEAASEGDQVLAVFRQREAEQQQGGVPSSIPPPPATTSALSSLSLSGMVQGIRSATNSLFFTDEDTKKLNSVVERLEKLDLWEFISLLQLEILPKMDHGRPKKRKRPQSPPPRRYVSNSIRTMCRREQPLGNQERMRGIQVAIWHVIRSEIHGLPRRPVEAWIAGTSEYKEYQSWITLRRRLTPVISRIGWAVNMAVDRDLDDSGGLAQWAAILNSTRLLKWDMSPR